MSKPKWPHYYHVKITISDENYEKWRKKARTSKIPIPHSGMGIQGTWALETKTLHKSEADRLKKLAHSFHAQEVTSRKTSLQPLLERTLYSVGCLGENLSKKEILETALQETPQGIKAPQKFWKTHLAQTFLYLAAKKSLLQTKDGWQSNPQKIPKLWESYLPLRLQRNLLHVAKAKKAEIEELLQTTDTHWGAEDAFYRFYHQSFKVFHLQEKTEKIVELLRKIGTESQIPELNSWFEKIIKEGTGKQFSMASNRNWLEETRPILEAFFHAREMLRHLAHYSQSLSQVTYSLPSGWAAVLYLYKIR